MKLLKKVLVILLIIMCVLPTQLIQVLAVNKGDSVYLQRGDLSFYCLQYWNASKNAWYYIICNTVWYVDTDGSKRIAYAVEPEKSGIGYVTGIEGYSADLQKYLEDDRLWRIYKNGYPYVSKEALGTETEDDAYLATKQAAFWIINNKPLDGIYSYFRGGETSIAGQDVNETKRRGQKVVNAIYKLVDIGYNGKQTPKYSGIVSIKASGDFIQDTNSNYYSQKYNVTAETKMSEYNIKSITGFPEGSYVANINGSKQTSFKAGESFKVMVPKKAITSNITGKIEIEGRCQTYPVLYAVNQDGYQSHAVINDSYSPVVASATLKIDAFKSSAKLVVEDKETKEKLANTVFHAQYLDGSSIGDFTTNDKGEVLINNLKQGTIILTQTSSQNDYVLDNTPTEIEVEYNDDITINITNTHKKGA